MKGEANQVKKWGGILGIVGAIAALCIGVYLFLAQPKLEANLLATGLNKKAAVITLGNTGFQDIKVLEVLINHSEMPDIAKIQLNDSGEGFILTESFTEEGYAFEDFKDGTIESGTAQKDRPYALYGLTFTGVREIYSVTIVYTYLGRDFEETVTVL